MKWVEWLKVEGNQKFLGWLGAAVVAVAGAVWTAYGVVSGRAAADAPKPPAPPVAASSPASVTPAPVVAPAPAVVQSVVTSGSGVAAAVNGSGNVVQIGK